MSVKMISIEEKPIAEKDIDQFERAIGIVFPATYRQFLKEFNVANPERNVINSNGVTVSISEFFGKSDTKIYDIVSMHEAYNVRMPDDVFPIAVAGGGNMFCLQDKTGAVFLWDHEEEAGEDEIPSYDNMTLLTPDFSSFLGIIQPYTDEKFARDTHGMRVISSESSPDFNELFKDYLIKK
jgi:hypothetical protein